MRVSSIVITGFLLVGSYSALGNEVIAISDSDHEVMALELEKEAKFSKHDKHTKEYLKKIAKFFRNSKDKSSTSLDGSNCNKDIKGIELLTKLGRSLGKSSAWLTTVTAKPFMNASAFVTGSLEKKTKNEDVLALYKFFLNHEAEFDTLHSQAATSEELIELMMAKMDEIIEKKSHIIMKDLLVSLGIKREIPSDMKEFELTDKEIASIDKSKLDVNFVNNHPEYADIRPLIGDMSKDDLMDLVSSGYFSKAIAFENYASTLPNPYEIGATLIAQTFVPRLALKVISSSAATLYTVPVLAAQAGSAISAGICAKEETKEKFSSDEDLKNFCSYVTNRSSYKLFKSRAKGYVAGKAFHEKVVNKLRPSKGKKVKS